MIMMNNENRLPRSNPSSTRATGQEYHHTANVVNSNVLAGDRATRHNQQLRKTTANGFTLVELMVVIFILGLLTTVVVINVLPSQDRAMVEKARADIATIGQALEMYRLDNLEYPSSSEGLSALVSPPNGLSATSRYRRGGYIKKLPDDPWGQAYQYDFPGLNGSGFDLYSLGADGVPGGEDDNADIYAD